MKKVEVTKKEYADIVYLAVATSSAKDIKELRLTSKVLDKLEAQAVEGDDGVSSVLKGEQATFLFEDAEADFLKNKIEETFPKLQAWAARKALPIIDQLEAKGFTESPPLTHRLMEVESGPVGVEPEAEPPKDSAG